MRRRSLWDLARWVLVPEWDPDPDPEWDLVLDPEWDPVLVLP